MDQQLEIICTEEVDLTRNQVFKIFLVWIKTKYVPEGYTKRVIADIYYVTTA